MLSFFIQKMMMLTSLQNRETKGLLANAAATLPDRFRTNNQFLGGQYAGCAATIGVMPKCDFACNACYLGKDANRIPMESIEGIKQQMDDTLTWLGAGGNVQITDGEVTLRPIEDLIEIIQYARSLKLVPMLMTHGDALRKEPSLLRRLMLEGGLSEISIHIDTTQKGRLGSEFRHAKEELQLMPLRNEFMQLIRDVKRETGKSLKVAMTVTVMPENLAGIAAIVEWCNKNSDIVTMISFQPVAQVGRTLEGSSTAQLNVEAVWDKIHLGLMNKREVTQNLSDHQGYFGHADCTRFIQGLVVLEAGKRPFFHPLFRGHGSLDQVFLQDFLQLFGGISPRSGSSHWKYGELFLAVCRRPVFTFHSLIPFVLSKVSQLKSVHGMGLLWKILIGKAQINYLNIISHHFMSSQQIDTTLGQERIKACVFKVPINGKMISMCEVNAKGHRENYYARLKIKGLSIGKKY